ncbi:MAG TPA: efflux RND transporter periplasmic adaptor subunit [Rhodocyclaceae bacterium]
MKPIVKRLLLGIVIIAALVAAIAFLTRPEPIKVVVAAADRGRVESTLSNTRAGTLESCQRTRLSTILGGRIDALLVKEGDRVAQGQVLMRLWNEDQQAQATLAEAQLMVTRQRIDEICTVADNAGREAERQAQLQREGFVSAGREDQARTEAKARRAACETARADVGQAEARLRAVQVEQRRTVLRAPFAGTVAKIVGEVGEYSTPSPPGVQTPPAIDLFDPGCLYVKAPMDEVDAPKIRAGLPARITLDALGKRVFEARVGRVAPVVTALEKQARTVDVDVLFAKPEEATGLLVGYSADAEIILDTRDSALRVPTAALQEDGRVLLLEGDKLVARMLKTGVSNWEYTEVLDGLAEGAQVVTSLEREGVRDGASAVVDDRR